MAKKKDTKEKQEVIDPADDVRRWHSLIQASMNRRQEVSEQYHWIDFIESFKGHFNITNVSSDPNIVIPPINLIYAYVKTEIPSLYLRDPHIEVIPKKGSSILSAKIRELAINYIWRTKKFKAETKKNIWDALIVGHSWFKSGYTGKFGSVEDGNGHVTEYIESEDFFGYRVPWKHITFNLESTDPPNDCRWIAHEVLRPLEDVQKNKRYKNTEDLEGSPLIDGELENKKSKSLKRNAFQSEVLWVKLFEVRDIVNKKIFTLAEGHDQYLESPKDWPYKMKGFGFQFLAFNKINDEAYPIADVYMGEPQVMELIKIRAMQLDHLKRFNRQYESEKGNLDEEAKTNLSLGLTGAVIEPNQIGKLIPISYPPIQSDIYAIEDRVRHDLGNVWGQSDQDRGANQKAPTRTIGELLQIQRSTQNRRSDKVDVVEDFLEDIARDQISLLMQFATEPFYVKLTGTEPKELLEQLKMRPSATNQTAVTDSEGFTFNKEDIQGEFDIDIKAGSTIPLDRENKLNLLLQILELLPKTGATPGGPLYGALAKEIAGELDLVVIEQALQEEVALQGKMKEEMQKKQDEMMQMQAAQYGSDKQLEAEKVQQKSTSDLLKVLITMINAQGGENGKNGKEKEGVSN